MDFKKSARVLLDSVPLPENIKIGQPQIRIVAPAVVLCIFTIELFLKCLLADAGTKTIPATHNPALLFKNLPKATRTKILGAWTNDLAARQEVLKTLTSPDLVVLLTSMDGAFDQWRYRFQHDKKNMKRALVDFWFVQAFLHRVITAKHPDWEKSDDQHFRSTFPIP